MNYVFLALLSLMFVIARFVVPVEGRIDHADIFKDLAHVFVGGLFGAAIITTKRNYEMIPQTLGTFRIIPAALAEIRLWALAVGLTSLEVIAFLIRQKN